MKAGTIYRLADDTLFWQEERERQRQRERERELREEDRRRRNEVLRQREIEKMHREEAMRLERWVCGPLCCVHYTSSVRIFYATVLEQSSEEGVFAVVQGSGICNTQHSACKDDPAGSN